MSQGTALYCFAFSCKRVCFAPDASQFSIDDLARSNFHEPAILGIAFFREDFNEVPSSCNVIGDQGVHTSNTVGVRMLFQNNGSRFLSNCVCSGGVPTLGRRRFTTERRSAYLVRAPCVPVFRLVPASCQRRSLSRRDFRNHLACDRVSKQNL